MKNKKTRKKQTQNHKSSIIEKFKKKDDLCNICEQQNGFSQDHVPPRSCPSPKSIAISKLLYQMVGDKSFRPRNSQNGVIFETICQDCNNKLGSNYDWALADFSHYIERFINSNLILPEHISVQCHPNAIIRSILGHLLAAKTETDSTLIDKVIRPCILDSSLPIPSEISVSYWIYPYERIAILRDFAMPSVRGKLQSSSIFNLIKFYPIAFLIAFELSAYEGLNNLNSFHNIPVDDKIDVLVNLKDIKPSTWPEECLGRENFLVIGKAAESSVFAIPKITKLRI